MTASETCFHTPLVLTHIAIHCDDIDKSIEFYSKYCNLKIVDQREGLGDRVVWLGDGTRNDFVFVLLPNRKADCPHFQAPKDISHYGFGCISKEIVDEKAKMAEEDGILVIGPKTLPPSHRLYSYC
ncbi:hypothetical protein GEMRC1_002359 [Eukaryota sp. GEM-RC1]